MAHTGLVKHATVLLGRSNFRIMRVTRRPGLPPLSIIVLGSTRDGAASGTRAADARIVDTSAGLAALALATQTPEGRCRASGSSDENSVP